MIRSLLLHTLVIVGIALAISPVRGEEKSRRPNVLLIIPDQLRAQGLGCMGNPDVKTPHLDRLAA
jgi:N-sulfoglucosamine sulfohydrolase